MSYLTFSAHLLFGPLPMNSNSDFSFTSLSPVGYSVYMPLTSNTSDSASCRAAVEKPHVLSPTCKPSQIHINPLMYTPRNIYINKAFTSTPCPPPALSTQKPERVYYNPRFLNSTTTFPQKPLETKKESNIYINPNFIKNERAKNSESSVTNSRFVQSNIPVSKKPSSSSGIHVNPMFLKNMPSETSVNTGQVPTVTPCLAERLNPPISSTSVTTPRQRFVSKYKIVRKKVSPVVMNNSYYARKVRSSMYKKINQISARKKKTRIVKGKFLKYVSPNLINKKKPNIQNLSEFKSIGMNKLVRKSVLQKQIESRSQVRKISKISLVTPVQKILSPRKSGDKVSQYKIVRSTSESAYKKLPVTTKTVNTKRKVPRRKKNSLVYSSLKYRADKKKVVAAFIKTLKKNNQPCPFYNRYGHCKGKDKGTCQKLHDPKYIAICKRFVKGECKDEKCTLSHDIRPEKMPTCHHYLAGLCQRTDCPYLHIKVNPKALICRAFLQGFCADVFNCTKRHEYLCPVFAAEGTCPRQKFCPYPHRSQAAVISKLLEPDEFPLLNRKRKPLKSYPKRAEVSTPNQNDSSNSSPKEESDPPAEEPKSKEFKRYFLTSLSDN